MPETVDMFKYQCRKPSLLQFKVVTQKPHSQLKVCSAKWRDEVTCGDFSAEVKRYLDESEIVEGVEQSWVNFRTDLNSGNKTTRPRKACEQTLDYR